MIIPSQLAAVLRALRRPPATRPEILEYQNRRLRRLVAHAYERVPFYRRRFEEAGVRPPDIRTVEDLRHLPVITRQEFQAEPADQLVARGLEPDRLIVRKTSGSSGRPLSVRRTRLEERVHNAFAARALRWYGLGATDRHCYVMSPRAFEDGRLVQAARRLLGLWRHHDVVSCFQSPQEIVDGLRRLSPRAIAGFPVVLSRLAEVVGADVLHALRVQFLTTGGEVMTPLMRHQINRGFGAPVYDVYGSQEFHLLAWQCRATDRLHVSDDSLVLEVLDRDTPVTEGQDGEVVATNLHAWAMPIIRYRLGDVVTRGGEQCLCGQPFSTIRAVRGRMRDYFRLADGRLIHPYQLAFAVGVEQEFTPWIREFQMTQEREDLVVMRVIPFTTPSASELELVRQKAGAVLGSAVVFRVELVADLKLDPSGKFRVYRSLVESPYGSETS